MYPDYVSKTQLGVNYNEFIRLVRYTEPLRIRNPTRPPRPGRVRRQPGRRDTGVLKSTPVMLRI